MSEHSKQLAGAIASELKILRQVRHVLDSKLENTTALLAEAEANAGLPGWEREADRLRAVRDCLETIQRIAGGAPND